MVVEKNKEMLDVTIKTLNTMGFEDIKNLKEVIF